MLSTPKECVDDNPEIEWMECEEGMLGCWISALVPSKLKGEEACAQIWKAIAEKVGPEWRTAESCQKKWEELQAMFHSWVKRKWPHEGEPLDLLDDIDKGIQGIELYENPEKFKISPYKKKPRKPRVEKVVNGKGKAKKSAAVKSSEEILAWHEEQRKENELAEKKKKEFLALFEEQKKESEMLSEQISKVSNLLDKMKEEKNRKLNKI